jgi:hypothetical protein
MNALYLIGGIAVLFIVIMLALPPRGDAGAQEAHEVAWDDEYDESAPEAPPPPTGPRPRFQEGDAVAWPQIEGLLWACGYTRDQVQAESKTGYVYIFRGGVHAEFQWFGDYDRRGEPVYRCEVFNPHASTDTVDRWNREPSDDERRRALWREQ